MGSAVSCSARPRSTWSLVGPNPDRARGVGHLHRHAQLIAVWFRGKPLRNAGWRLHADPATSVRCWPVRRCRGWRRPPVGVGGVHRRWRVVSLVLAALCWLVVTRSARSAGWQRNGNASSTAPCCSTACCPVVRNRATWPAILVNTGTAGFHLCRVVDRTIPDAGACMERGGGLAPCHSGSAVLPSAACYLVRFLDRQLGRRKPVIIGAAHVLPASGCLLFTSVTMPRLGVFRCSVWRPPVSV